MKEGITKGRIVVVGLDLSDRSCQFCGVDSQGNRVREAKIKLSPSALKKHFQRKATWKIVLESGTPARWVTKFLKEMGHEVRIVNPRKMRRIYENENKSDVVDARELAEAGLTRWNRLPEVKLRGDKSQSMLTVLQTRDILVRTRASIVNRARTVLKHEGIFPPKCSVEAAPKRFRPLIPEFLQTAIETLLDEVESLSAKISDLDKWIENETNQDPAIQLLRKVPGVGPVTAVAYVCTLDNPERFSKSRMVGSYLGLRPRRDQSGEIDRQLRITKAGNVFLRRLLVSCAHHILGKHGPDSQIKRWGLKLAERGGKRAKRKAVVAVARKLSVVLHHLWRNGEIYEAFPNGIEAGA